MYFGSVRFFKHLIVTVFLLIFLVPLVLAIIFGIKNAEINKQLAKTEAAVTGLSKTVSEEITAAVKQMEGSLITQKSALEDEINSYISSQVGGLGQKIDAYITYEINDLDTSIGERLSALRQELSVLNSRLAVIQQQLNDYAQKVGGQAVLGK